MILGRELLAQAGDHLQRRVVTVPGFDGAVLVRELNDGQASKVQKLAISAVRDGVVVDADRLAQMRSLMVFYAWIDGDGTPVLKQGEESEIANLPRRLVDAMAEAIAELSGMKDAEGSQASGSERAEKN